MGPAGICSPCLVRAGAALALNGGAEESEYPVEFGAYELTGELGRGGAGRVYAARHRALGRTVAVKVLAGGELASRDFVQRFRNEARAAANLTHPHIVPVFECGEHEGLSYLVMPLITGGSLAKRLSALRPGRMAAEEAAGLIVPLARALHHAHQRGVLHRDVKPGNILLDAAGAPHLTDFGLARLVGQDSTLTRTNAVLGTPSYMPPEQARGDAVVTTAADIYGLGAVFYELLTGQPPFAGGTTYDTVRLLLETEPRRPSALSPGLDRDLETICLKCLRKEPEARYGSALAMAEDIERWARHEPITARPVTAAERVRKWVRRHRALSASLAVAAVLGTAGIVALAAANARLTEVRVRLDALAEQRRGDLVRLHVETGNRLAVEGDGFAALAAFAEAAALDAAVPERLAAHRFRFAATLAQLPPLERALAHDGAVRHAAMSPDGDLVAAACADRTVRLWKVSDGSPAAPPLPHRDSVWWVGFAADGTRVLSRTTGGALQLWDTATGAPAGGPFQGRAAMNLQDGLAADPGIDPYGKHFAVLDGRHVEVRSATDGALVGPPIELPTAGGDVANAAVFAPDGAALAVLCEEGSLFTVALPDGRITAAVRLGSGWRTGAWNTDGRRLALTDRAFNALTVDASLTDFSAPLHHLSMALGSAWAPAGERLLTWSFDNNARVWDPVQGQESVPALRHRGPVPRASFRPDGSLILSASIDGTARLWHAASGMPAGPVLRHGAPVLHASWNRDGSRILTSAADGMVRVWNPDGSPRRVRVLPVGNPVQQVAVSPDGARVLVRGLAPDALVFDLARPDAAPVRLHHESLPHDVAWRGAEGIVTTGADGTLHRWKADGSAEAPVQVPPFAAVRSRLSPDGQHLADFSGPRLRIVRTEGAGEPRSPGDGEVRWVVWSACGGHLMALGDDTWMLHDLRAGTSRVLTNLPRTFGPRALHSGGRLAAGVDDRFGIRVVDLATGEVVAGPMRHDSTVRAVSFSADGTILASTGEDLTLRLWSLPDGVPLAPPLTHPAYVLDVSMGPEGRTFVTAGNDGRVRCWEVPAETRDPDALRRLARELGGATP